MSKHKITVMDYYSKPAQTKKGLDNERLCIAVPKDLHKILSEITFRECISIKQFFIEASNDMFDAMDIAENEGNSRYSGVYKHNLHYTSDELVHPSIILPSETVDKLKEAAHYGKEFGVPDLRHLIIDMLIERVLSYQNKYKDVVARMVKFAQKTMILRK